MSENTKNQSNTITSSAAILGAVLFHLRTTKGLKQSDLAEAVGTGVTTWSRIEKGETGITFDQLRAVSKVLGITPGDLFELIEVAEIEAKEKGIRVEEGSTKKLDSTFASVAAAVGATAGISVFIPIVGPLLGGLISAALAAKMASKK